VQVRGEQVGSRESAELEDRGEAGRDAVDVRIDEHVVIGPVDRVVEDRAVEAELYAGHADQRPEIDDRVADFASYRVPDALIVASLCHLGACWIPEQDPDGHPGSGRVGEQAMEGRLLPQPEGR